MPMTRQPRLMNQRPPWRSMRGPRKTAARAPAMVPAERAPAMVVRLQPNSFWRGSKKRPRTGLKKETWAKETRRTAVATHQPG